jgi:hypothetical protein
VDVSVLEDDENDKLGSFPLTELFLFTSLKLHLPLGFILLLSLSRCNSWFNIWEWIIEYFNTFDSWRVDWSFRSWFQLEF